MVFDECYKGRVVRVAVGEYQGKRGRIVDIRQGDPWPIEVEVDDEVISYQPWELETVSPEELD